MPYWLTSTLAATPAFLWVFLGLGLPWALAVLPRKDWRDRALVACLSLALGPALLTAWMFALGTLGTASNPLLRFDLVFGGTVVLAALGGALAWRRRRASLPPPDARTPLDAIEKLLIALIAAAIVVRWLGIAYWTFTAYDALWVYGYEGRLYALFGSIPTTIGYYPQFLPLQFTYAQLAVGGIDDHAARAGLIFLHVGSILATYVLGSRLFNRRTGIFAAALWALYPHVGEWSRFGDLEIPLTFSFTLASAFFLMAWTGQAPRRHYTLLAGLVLGVALWTKPTAGAFVFGVILLLILELVRVRLNVRAWLPRFEVAALTGLAALPLGGVWYVRNVLLGHPAVNFPPPFWQTLAQQSGAEFGWLLLALLVLLAYLFFGARGNHPNAPLVVIGLILIALGMLPSIFTPRRITALEWIAIAAGGGILYSVLARHIRGHWNREQRSAAERVGWALALAAPYFVTWFISYSYHYRLSFAIVPLLLLPTAVILADWLKPTAATTRRLAVRIAIVLISLPAIANPLYDPNAGWDWLWTDKLPDDFARYESGNAALMNVVEGFEVYKREQTTPLTVVAPGVKRLPFFFPLDDIRIETTPTTFDALEGVVYFVDSAPEGVGAYETVPLIENQVLSALNRADVMRPAWGMDDGIFRYQVYELHLDNRFVKPETIHVPARGDVVFGNFARFLGHSISGNTFWEGRELSLTLYWQAIAPAPDDYTIYIHLRDRAGNVLAAWDGPVARSEDGQRYYSTRVWEPKEFITDPRALRLTQPDTPLGDDYQMVIGMYNAVTGERVPLTINGKASEADGYSLGEQIHVTTEP